jgi:hypothetical protein
MKKIFILTTLLIKLLSGQTLPAQTDFQYDLSLQPVSIAGLLGLQSYAFAQHQSKWLIVGGRKDGLHARQPFNSFPASQNNTQLYVIDVAQKTFKSRDLSSLNATLQEHLQATNYNFYQLADTLYLIGGYAYASSAQDHITFPYLTTIQVPALINAIENNLPISNAFKQVRDERMAVTGGQLGKIKNTFYLVGGHRFDGRYNPMGNPTFTQTYTNEIRKFSINNSSLQPTISNYTTISDPIHLHRRDFNLLPQIFPDGSEGYTLSSGVFQIGADLPYLYPVDIKEDTYSPITSFNQYLSHYHSAKVALYDSLQNKMHNLFFGGMSQYYYQNGQLIQDNLVPFVRTISRLTRSGDGSLQEYVLPVSMPALKGASAEFISNRQLPHTNSEIIKLSKINQDTILIGHIYGGILSPSLNPFNSNQTNTTAADNSIYAVYLIKNKQASSTPTALNGENKYDFEVYPNPNKGKFTIKYHLPKVVSVDYYLSTLKGELIEEGELTKQKVGNNTEEFVLNKQFASQILILTIVFDKQYAVSKRISIIKQK